MLTDMKLLQAISALDMTVRKQDGEYRVAYPLVTWTSQGKTMAQAKERQEATAYYASDKQDALDTATAMRNTLNARDYTL